MKPARMYNLFSQLMIISSLTILLTACGSKQSTTASTSPPKAALTVEVITPIRELWPQSITASGTVQAWQEASIGAEINGLKLNQVVVNVGDQVHKGQLLAQFSDDTVKAELMQQQAAIEEAIATMMKAKNDHERAQSLDHTGALSQQDLIQYRTTFKTSQARLATVKAQYFAQQLKLRYTKVVAPADGIISSRTATIGAVLSAGSELFKMIVDGRLEWRAEVSSEALMHIHRQQKAEIVLPGDQHLTISGIVRQLAPNVSNDTRNGLVYIDIPKATSCAIKAGMFVSGHIFLPDRQAFSIPESAIVVRDGYHYVMKVDASYHVHQIKVTTGRHLYNRVELLNTSFTAATVNLADRIVLNGGNFLIEGDVVRVVNTSVNPSEKHSGAQ